MEKKYQVFISSTYLDLKEERQKVVEAVLNSGHIPAGMELFHAGDETQKELIEEWIEDSDIYILILGGRYGSLDSDGKGYTHWEYDRAQELGKPRFSLVLTDNYLTNKVRDGKLEMTSLELSNPKLIEFKSEVMSKMVSEIDNIDRIEAEVLKSIHRIIKRQSKDLEGWVKGNVLNELGIAQQKIDKLQEKLDQSRQDVISKSDELISFQTTYPKNVLGNTPSEISQLLQDITASKEVDEILRNEMKWITDYLVKIGKENRVEHPNPDNTISGEYDGKYGLAVLQVGKSSLNFKADYLNNLIGVEQFIRGRDDSLTHDKLSIYSWDSVGVYKNDQGNLLDMDEVMYWIAKFLEKIKSVTS